MEDGGIVAVWRARRLVVGSAVKSVPSWVPLEVVMRILVAGG